MTVEKLKCDDYQSRTRNKLVAEAFYLTREKEQIGVLVGRYDRADILEEDNNRIYIMPYWML